MFTRDVWTQSKLFKHLTWTQTYAQLRMLTQTCFGELVSHDLHIADECLLSIAIALKLRSLLTCLVVLRPNQSFCHAVPRPSPNVSVIVCCAVADAYRLTSADMDAKSADVDGFASDWQIPFAGRLEFKS